MGQSARRQVALVKLETTYGVDAAPTTTDVVAVRPPISYDLSVDAIDRPLVRPYSGAFDQIIGAKMVKLTFIVDYAGFGTAGPTTPTPGLHALLQMCGLAAVITSGSDVSYNPVTDTTTHKSATIYYYYDGILHKALGCRANLKIDGKRGDLTSFTFDIMGIYGGTVDAALPSPISLTAYQPPLRFRIGNDTFPALFGKNAGLCIESFAFDVGNVLLYFDRPDCTENITIVDRKSTGQVVMEATKVANMDAAGQVTGQTTQAFQWTHGVTAGNIVKLLAPALQPTDVGYSEDNFIRMQTMDFMAKPLNGNDDFIIKVQ